ncbi:hypothetical protein IK146_01500 [Candidatus Saccharibacteria bacterium]|nr:hypothetical protein [Candidatus Saccharibacteria bacterium]
MKNRFIILLASFSAVFCLTMPAFATDVVITEKQSADISDYCGTIRQNLKNLQRTDARARTYFGAIYETVSSKYLKPLNLRIVNNDLSNATLLKLQSDFAEARMDFSEDYIKYSKSLEELISTDCRIEPIVFYKKLVETREKRAVVASDIKTLNDLLTSVVKNTENLKETLK